MEEKILEICEDVDSSIDYSREDLIDGGHITSVTLIAIIGEISDAFDIDIPYEDIIPENFNSIAAMADLVESYV